MWRRQSAGINWKEKNRNFALGKCASIIFLGKRSFCWKKITLLSSIKKKVFQITKTCKPFSSIPLAPNHKNLQLKPTPWQADAGKGN